MIMPEEKHNAILAELAKHTGKRVNWLYPHHEAILWHRQNIWRK
jgi:hypothetical protein